MTDLLGVCLSWADGRCVVAPETGEPVSIALADIVSGKPVPPRPSVRHRVSVREAESRTLSLWPGLASQPLGEWVLRSQPRVEGRLVKRANSALAIGDPAMSLERAAATISDFYSQRSRPALVQVEAGSEVDDHFAAAGWESVPGGDSLFLIAALSRAVRACGPPDRATPCEISEDGPRVLVTLADGTARGSAAYDDDWLGINGLEVDPGHRGQCRGTAILRELLEWGGELGARTAWLHVEIDNDPALAFYERLGFTTHHELRYRISPTGIPL